MLRKGLYGLVGSLTMFLFLSNKLFRKPGPHFRLWAHAFSSTRDVCHKGRRIASASRTNIGNVGKMSSFLLEEENSKSKSKWYSTTTNLYDGIVEQDLDSALDDLLSSTFDGETDGEVDGDGLHMKDSKPIPSTLIEEVSFFMPPSPPLLLL